MELRGAQAEHLMREAGLPTEGVERIVMTHRDKADTWDLNVKYRDPEALLDAHALTQDDPGILAARDGVAPPGMHRTTSLLSLVIEEKLRASGRMPRLAEIGSSVLRDRAF